MAWPGYLVFGGAEIINVARTEAYTQADGAHWLIPRFKIPELAYVLGDTPYRSPLQDLDCPWFDANDPDSQGFYGFYPTNIDGLENSTRTSIVTENTTDGANPGRIRHAGRSVVVSGLLMGQDDAAVDFGMRWLRNALLSGAADVCNASGCAGADLCYLYAEPAYDSELPAGACGDDYLRFMHSAVVNQGPTLMSKHNLSDGSWVWEVQFTIIVGIPWEFGSDVPVLRNFRRDLTNYTGGEIDSVGHVVLEHSCPNSTFTPVFDPECPDLILPPSVPQPKLGCFKPPKNWLRRYIRIPGSVVPTWTDMVPVISIRVTDALRNMRIRFYSDPIGILDPDSDQCGFCSDMLITYCPSDSLMVIDGRTETVTVTTGGQGRRGDSLVLQSNGMPMSWPALSCGIGYLVTWDRPQSSFGLYTWDLTLVPRNR